MKTAPFVAKLVRFHRVPTPESNIKCARGFDIKIADVSKVIVTEANCSRASRGVLETSRYVGVEYIDDNDALRDKRPRWSVDKIYIQR